ncbi:hypothetical protein DFS34DRAFT_397328 [Phlyctochytrium arcticum]|nr:hypothetical protein DFS34DRAFT_397328 [Phlyctochytrium arcticum]
MGNTFTKAREDEVQEPKVDEGQVVPFKNGVYANAVQDWDHTVVKRFIRERRMAPFYKGLPDYDESAVRTSPSTESSSAPKPVRTASTSTAASGAASSVSSSTAHHLAWAPSRRTSHDRQPSSASTSTNGFTLKGKRSISMPSQLVSQESISRIRPEDLYRYSTECPICFLYYPSHINYSRCCDQPICTECFVQIKRPESTLEPAACPFCVEANFGIMYYPPGSPEYYLKVRQEHPDLFDEDVDMVASPGTEGGTDETRTSGSLSRPAASSKRRQSVSHKSTLVVTSDDLRPDWLRKQQQMALMRAANQRRAAYPAGQGGPGSRRRVYLDNDRDLSGAAAAAAALVESMGGMSSGGSGRSRRSGNDSAGSRRRSPRERVAGGDMSLNYLEAMRNMGADLEELMIMEAIRRSLQNGENGDGASPTGDVSVSTTENAASPTSTDPAHEDGPVSSSAGDTVSDGDGPTDTSPETNVPPTTSVGPSSSHAESSAPRFSSDNASDCSAAGLVTSVPSDSGPSTNEDTETPLPTLPESPVTAKTTEPSLPNSPSPETN